VTGIIKTFASVKIPLHFLFEKDKILDGQSAEMDTKYYAFPYTAQGTTRFHESLLTK
jgi:hypothetical protein